MCYNVFILIRVIINMNNQQLWQTALGELELNLSKANFITWFKSTTIVARKDNELTISVPNAFTKEWLENKYHKFILKTLQKNAPEITSINYIIGKNDFNIPPSKNNEIKHSTKTAKTSIKTEAKTKEPLARHKNDFSLNPRYTFDNFIVGSSNELAYAACFAVTKNLGTTYNPLFLYGGVGLGKTHLLQSIGNEVLKNYPDKKVRYTTSEKFTNELIAAIEHKKTELFKNFYRQIDILIIDDIQFLAGKEKTQEEFFHTFNSLYQSNKQIVLSSDRPPKAIPTIEERLRSRFEGGMIADVGCPDLETRIAILKAKTRERGFNVSDEVLDYICAHIQRNVRELEGALNRLIVSSQLENKIPTIEYAKEILDEIISKPPQKAMTPKKIIKSVAEFYDVSIEELLKKCRKKEIVKPRQIAMFLLRKEIQCSYPSIGSKLGGRDHTTAMHAFLKIEELLKNNKSIEQEINFIKDRIYNG